MRLDYFHHKDDVHKNLPRPYNLALPIQSGWKKSKLKVLVIIGHVSNSDLKARALLGGEDSRNTYTNVLRYAEQIAANYGQKVSPKYAFINFNYRKTYNLDKKTLRVTANKLATRRVRNLIKKLKPDLILVFGDEPAENITNNLNIRKYRGHIHDYKGTPLVNTIDIDRSFTAPEDKDDLDDNSVDYANILGYAARNLANGFIGRMPHDISMVKPRPILIRSILSFDRLIKRINKAKYIAIDTEGTSLETQTNRLQTLQFSIDSKRGFIIPIFHKDSHWLSHELEHIKNTLYVFFSQRIDQYKGQNTRYLIGQNFGYDIRVLGHWLGIRYWYWPIWDTMAGQQLLDENIRVLSKYDTPSYNLEQIALDYGNDFYLKAEFSKADRITIQDVPLNKEVLEYCSQDSQCLISIHREQLKASSYYSHGNVSYTEIYHKFMLVHMSSMIKNLSTMKYRGTKVDVPYLLNLLKPDSLLISQINGLTKELLSCKEVKKAGDIIKKANNLPTKGLFGDSGTVFDLGTKKHLKILYLDVLGLEPLSYGKSGEPSFDKYFLAAYKDNPVIAIITRINVLKTLRNSFINGFYDRIENSEEGRIDGRVRPDFGFLLVTGRTNSSGPSLQQIPEHSADAKIVKSMFVTPPLHLHGEADYSSHEVRVWAIMSKDKGLLKVFAIISQIIKDYRLSPTKENRERKDLEGDPHKQNYSFFTGTLIHKITKEMRQEAKGIVFGSMFGMSVASLARSINKSLDYANKVMGGFFKKFSVAGKWLDRLVDKAKEYLYVYSPIGRRRNLFGNLSSHQAVRAAMDRRAKNSVIQGFASDICMIAADLFARNMHELLNELGIEHKVGAPYSDKYTSLPTGANATVHDSIKFEGHIWLYFLHMHVLEWSMITGARQHLKNFYDLDMEIDFDIEFDLGASWALKSKWDWSLTPQDWNDDDRFCDQSLKTIVIRSIKDHKELYKDHPEVQKLEPEKVYKKMVRKYKIQCKKLDLNTRYPIGAPWGVVK